jgi:hypothetical protein
MIDGILTELSINFYSMMHAEKRQVLFFIKFFYDADNTEFIKFYKSHAEKLSILCEKYRVKNIKVDEHAQEINENFSLYFPLFIQKCLGGVIFSSLSQLKSTLNLITTLTSIKNAFILMI